MNWRPFLSWLMQQVYWGSAIPVSQHAMRTIADLADAEQASPADVAAMILEDALIYRQNTEEILRQCMQLSQRERQIVAYLSLKYSNQQIAERLYISPDTVKSHISRILKKLHIAKKAEFLMLLSSWDLSAWVENGEEIQPSNDINRMG